MAMKAKHRFATDEEGMAWVWNMEELKNLSNKRVYYVANNQRAEELEDLWVKDPENQKTASFGRNWGYYVGMDEIRRYYVDGCKAGGKGYGNAHPLSTWCIHIAKDGKTARGVWYTVGTETKGLCDDKAYWLGERVNMDFILEEDGWKIWHLFIGTDYFCEAGTSYMDVPVDLEPGQDPQQNEFGEPTIKMLAFNPRYNWYPYPELPVEYDTFTDDISCGPEGNPEYKK